FLGVGFAVSHSQADHWGECDCLPWLTRIDLERGRFAEALGRCGRLREIAAKMGDGSEAPLAAALEALARSGLGEPGAETAVDVAVATLRDIDTKRLLAYAQSFAAGLDVVAGRLDSASRRAEEALGAAEVVSRRTEVAVAHAILGRVALARGRKAEA